MERASLAAIAALALTACTPKGDAAKASPDAGAPVAASASASVVAPSDAAAPSSDDVHTERDYQGTLGERTTVYAHVERDGTMLLGTFRYGKPNAQGLILRGKVRPDGSYEADELSADGKTTTGKVAVREAKDGALAGSWTSPDGAKTYPVRLLPKGIPPAPRSVVVDFLVRLAKTTKKPMTPAEVDAALAGGETFLPKGSALAEHGIPIALATLYVADVNNDGKKDFLLVDKNTTGMHNDQIVGVWDEDGDALKELPFWTVANASFSRDGQFPMFRASPFLEARPEGTTMLFTNEWGVDEHGDTVGVLEPCKERIEQSTAILWKAGEPKLRVTPGPKNKTPCR